MGRAQNKIARAGLSFYVKMFLPKTISRFPKQQVLKRIPAYLNMPQLKVTDEYVQGFIQADQTFLYQVGYCLIDDALSKVQFIFDITSRRFKGQQNC